MKAAWLKKIAVWLLALALFFSAMVWAEEALWLEVEYDASPDWTEEAPEPESDALSLELGEMDLPAPEEYALDAVLGEYGEEQGVEPAPELVEELPKAAEPAGPVYDYILGVKQQQTLNTKKLGKKLSFKSTAAKIASVDKNGVVTAKKKGTATIICTSGKKEKKRWEIKVVAAPKKVSFSPKKLSVGVKESFSLGDYVVLTKGSAASFTWASKDKKIATVSKAGKITGKKVGKTTVTVTTHNGKKASLTVNVMKAPKKVTLDQASITLEVGGTAALKATLPKKTASRLTWKSDNPGVASVDESGVVTAVGPGTATITVKTFNKKQASCAVTVQGNPEPSGEFIIQDGVVVGYTGPGGAVVIPSADAYGNPVTAVGPSAFAGNGALTSVTIPFGVTRIEAYAFDGCPALAAVYYPNSVSEFGAGVFRNCPSLETLGVSG